MAEQAMEEAVWRSLRTLKVLADAYDAGNTFVAASMATEIVKVFTENKVAARMRGECSFLAVNFEFSPWNITPETPLVAGYIDNASEAPHAMCLPIFIDNAVPTRRASFREWWNRDVIFRAGAYATGVKLPKKERRTMTRNSFVTDVRNTLGAHIDGAQHELVELLKHQSDAMGLVMEAVQPDGSVLSSADGTLDVRATPLEAMIRQIAFEVLEAYGLDEEREAIHGKAEQPVYD